MILIAHFSKVYLRKRWNKKKKEIEIQHEHEIEKVEKKLLEEKLKSQNEELKRVTDVMIYKSNMMSKIDKELEKISTKNSLENKDLSGLKQIIEKNKNPKEEWESFEVSFNKTYDNFLVKLHSKFPKLSKNDLSVAAYIRMNLSSKEIAGLLHISERSVEIARYRLRKKLNLDRNQSLIDFLLDINQML